MSGGMMVDLQTLEQFFQTLHRFDDELADSVGNLESHWAQLGSVWRDEKYDEFAANWEEALAAMRKYLDEAPDNTRFLRQKADAVADYLA